MDGFILKEIVLCKEHLKSYEGMMAQGNGYFSVRGSFEEGLADAPQDERYNRLSASVTTEIQKNPLSKFGTYVPTVMGMHPALGEVIINLPYFMEFIFHLDGERVDMLRAHISDYSRHLCMKDGSFVRRFIFQSKTGCRIQFEFSRFAHMSNKNLFVQKISYRILEGSGLLTVTAGINANVMTNGYDHFENLQISGDINGLRLDTETDTGFKTHMFSCVRSENPVPFSLNRGERHIAYTAEYQVIVGDENAFLKLTGLCSSRDLSYDRSAAERAVRDAEGLGYDELLSQSAKVWCEKWDFLDIRVKGDTLLQFTLRFSVYHLIRACNEEDYRTQICAKGFAGEAYYGQYFWDTEIYMLPFFIYTNPKAARNLLRYRYHTLDGARKNAEKYFSSGARYAWQSGMSGTEQCGLWQYADNEVHITADVAYGIMHYFKATGDFEFMSDYGIEILLETARFWVCRADKNKRGGYDILNVMGPDEYSPMTRNNLFTNRMAKFNLESAVSTAELLKEQSPEAYTKLAERLGLKDGELKAFTETAQNLVLPYDVERKLWLQSEDFESFADLDIDGMWKDRNRAFGYFVHQEKIYRSKCLKQADVIALIALFPKEFTNEEVETAYDYYLPLTTHDSSLSPASHGRIAARLGRFDDMENFIKLAAAVDLDLDRKGAEGGIHIANCGCLWQFVVNGLCGINSAMDSKEPGGIPSLPGHIDSIEFKIIWKGEVMNVLAAKSSVSIKEL